MLLAALPTAGDLSDGTQGTGVVGSIRGVGNISRHTIHPCSMAHDPE